MLVGTARPLAPYLALAAMWLAGMGAVLWLAAPGLRRLTNFLGIPWSWVDREFGYGLRLGELLAGTLAALFVLLPGGGPGSVWTLLRIVLVLGALLLALARPLQVVVIAVAAIPFVGVVARTGVFDRPVAEMLILVLAAAWVLRALWTRVPPHPRGLWLSLPLYFGLAALAAAVFADFQKFAFRDLRTVILEPLLLFLIVTAAARSRGDVQRVLAALVVGVGLTAVVALILIPAGAVVTDTAVPRLRGLFGSPNNLAMVLERALPLALGLGLAAWPGGRQRRVWWIALGVLTVGLVLTFSRGAWIGALVGLVVVAWPAWTRTSLQARLASLASAALVIVFAVLTFGLDTLGQAFRVADRGAASRTLLWDAAWRMIGDHLVFGVGPDNFIHHYRAYLRPEAWREPNLSHPHNLLLDAWLSVGPFRSDRLRRDSCALLVGLVVGRPPQSRARALHRFRSRRRDARGPGARPGRQRLLPTRARRLVLGSGRGGLRPATFPAVAVARAAATGAGDRARHRGSARPTRRRCLKRSECVPHPGTPAVADGFRPG